MSPSAMLTQYPSEGNWDPSANGRGLSAWRLGWWGKLTWQGIYIAHFLGSTVPNHQIIPLTSWSHEAHAGARLASGGSLTPTALGPGPGLPLCSQMGPRALKLPSPCPWAGAGWWVPSESELAHPGWVSRVGLLQATGAPATVRQGPVAQELLVHVGASGRSCLTHVLPRSAREEVRAWLWVPGLLPHWAPHLSVLLAPRLFAG